MEKFTKSTYAKHMQHARTNIRLTKTVDKYELEYAFN